MNKKTDIQISSFEKDVITGLTSTPKYLSSKYFYDDEGSRIFQQIMQMPEYYLTNCELEIFSKSKQAILESFSPGMEPFDLIELGAGDGMKTAILLQYFLEQDISFEYMPIDISGEAVNKLMEMMRHKLPELTIHGKTGDYFEMMDDINQYDHHKKILMFLGSNIGNFNLSESISFLQKLNHIMQQDDLLFIGFDLKKEPRLILDAYNDPQGHTAAFNLNLLQRMNDELDADFYLGNFKHREDYNHETGIAKSFLISLKKQTVTINKLNTSILFEAGEKIFMEMSQKYDLPMINDLAANSGFKVAKNFFDSREYFVNSLWRVME